MVSRFVALPVKKGDSFLLDQEERTLLVDGGEEPSFVNLLSNYWKKTEKIVDVVVCTHNDKDHSDGIIQLLSSLIYKIVMKVI